MVPGLRKEIFAALFATYLGACTMSTSTAEQQHHPENISPNHYPYSHSEGFAVQKLYCSFTEGGQGKYVCALQRPLDLFSLPAVFEYDAKGRIRVKLQRR